MLRSDEHYLRIALRLASRGLGYTSPNPPVGAVIVSFSTGEIIAQGYHRAYGAPHAEVEALLKAGERAKGNILYVTLEPCCHYGKTPPCTEAILSAGIKRVVCGIRDPNPVAGGGLEILTSRGVEVRAGVLAQEVAYFTRFHLSRVLRKRPWVMMKVASSLDGKISVSTGDSKWITGISARKFAHKLRSQVDAILVGKNTVERDDPDLTVRLTKGCNPLRLVLDSRLKLSPRHRIFEVDETKRTIIFCVNDAPRKQERLFLSQGVRVVRLPKDNQGRPDLQAMLSFCHEEGISSILVEGGSQVHGSFLQSNLCDEVFFFYGPLLIGDPLGTPAVHALPLQSLREATKIFDLKAKKLGDSILLKGLTEAGEGLLKEVLSKVFPS